MSIIFILILISILSSYIISINDQLAQHYDIVVQIEKNFNSFYEVEFIIYYLLDFYQHNYSRIDSSYAQDFELTFSPMQRKLNFSVISLKNQDHILLEVAIKHSDLGTGSIVVNCFFVLENNGLLKLRNYKINKKDC